MDHEREKLIELHPDFDWAPLGEQWWRAAGSDFHARERQIRFAAAYFNGGGGVSLTEAARRAGYTDNSHDGSGMRGIGSRVAKTEPVKKLLDLAAAASDGSVKAAPINESEIDQHLTSMIRNGDATTKLRAISEWNKKQEIARREREAAAELSLEQQVIQFLELLPESGPLIAADCYFAQHRTLQGLPYLKELAPIIARSFPDVWARFRSKVRTHAVGEFDDLARGAVIPVSQIVERAKTQMHVSEEPAPAEAEKELDVGHTMNGSAQ